MVLFRHGENSKDESLLTPLNSEVLPSTKVLVLDARGLTKFQIELFFDQIELFFDARIEKETNTLLGITYL
jgi:hypothetical protein